MTCIQAVGLSNSPTGVRRVLINRWQVSYKQGKQSLPHILYHKPSTFTRLWAHRQPCFLSLPFLSPHCFSHGYIGLIGHFPSQSQISGPELRKPKPGLMHVPPLLLPVTDVGNALHWFPHLSRESLDQTISKAHPSSIDVQGSNG